VDGLAESAGVENAIRAKLQGWKMQQWKKREYSRMECQPEIILSKP